MVRFTRSLLRLPLLLALVALGVFSLLFRRPRTRAARAEWLHRFCVTSLRRLGVSVRSRGAFPPAGAVISNHMGYLDIVAFAALGPCVFVSKSEIAGWPVLGWITTQSGTVYVRRGRGGSADRARSELRTVAAEGVPVVFFPEGTSGNGSSVLPFRTGLLADCIETGEPITAAFLSYRLTRPNAPGSAALLPYWDDTPLATHIFRILGLRGIAVEIAFADAPIPFSPAALADRHLAAAEARAAVLALKSDA
ncbi:MAG TPA: lysophospholipid acyltransferase family protein [Acidobacteriaceae bacterium]|nr:lysophospholipid acyltransferase family protein [Acidobacteriaceae bacterium]